MNNATMLLLTLTLTGCGAGTATFTPVAETKSAVTVEHTPTVEKFVVTSIESQANTGVAFDSSRNHMLHSVIDFAAGTNFVLETDINGKELSRLDVSGLIRYAQGIAYESNRDAIWIWGTRLDVPFAEWTDCFRIVVIDRSGNLIESFNTPIADAYPGMIALTADGNVWLKANTKSIARLYNPRDGFRFIREIETGTDGEGVAIDSHNRLWVHGEINVPHGACQVKSIDLSTGAETVYPSPSPKCGAEGLVFDSSERLWITTDDFYHYQTVDGNTAWAVSF